MANKEITEANRRAENLLAGTPTVKAVSYSKKLDRVLFELSDGLMIGVKPQALEELKDAKPEDLQNAEISPSGLGIHFSSIDADIYLPSLLEGHFGSKHWMAGLLGKAGGQARSKAKTMAARQNGKLGGRPKKAPVKKKVASLV